MQPPAWFIDPDRIVLEQGPDGKLVLLGRGSYGACLDEGGRALRVSCTSTAYSCRAVAAD